MTTPRVRPARPDEREAALQLALWHVPAAERPSRLEHVRTLLARRDLDPDGLLVAVDDGRVSGALLCTLLPGASSHLWPPQVLDETGRDRLEDRLYDHNRRATGVGDGRTLAFVALDPQGVQIGAIAGYSWASMAEIKQLWVDKSHRGRGHGRALLEAVIAEATVRGCQIIWLMSYDFQAPVLYEKCGFVRAAELADWPPGHTHVVLCRRLQPSCLLST